MIPPFQRREQAEAPASGPEDEPDEGEGEGEGEEDEGQGRVGSSPVELGERLSAMVEAEAAAAETAPEPPADFAGEKPPDDPYSSPCPTCKGWGVVNTGSLVEGNTHRQCRDCQGYGYVERGQPPAPAPARDERRELEPEPASPGAIAWR